MDAPGTRQVANTLVFDGLVDAVDEPSPEGVRTHHHKKLFTRLLFVSSGRCWVQRLTPRLGVWEFAKDEEVFYVAATLKIPERSAFTSTPCGVCPVFRECREDGLISPATCVYFNEWLAPLANVSVEW